MKNVIVPFKYNEKRQAKLTKEAVLEIRRQIAEKFADTDIAENFGVCLRSIQNIRTNRTWWNVQLTETESK